MGRPSIVLILTDDQRWDELRAIRGPNGPILPMPVVTSKLVRRGVAFSNAFVVNPVCCPSRSSILTGEYSHTTGVYTNNHRDGGFPAFRPREASTIATLLQSSGYRTGLFGKYLNLYAPAGRKGYVPPGWDTWVAFASDGAAYYDYVLNVDGRPRYRGHRAADYSTDVIARSATSFIRSTKGPLFVYFAPTAPHSPPVPAPRDVHRYSWLRPLRPRSYNEADLSDKPAWLRGHPSLGPAARARLDRLRRLRFQSLRDVDRAVGSILGALRDTGRLHNTMIVFMSDNGFLLGEHRLGGKQYPYEESIRVPMVIRYDPLTTSPRVDGHPVLNIDLAPTWAELAGVKPVAPDGRSLFRLLENQTPSWRGSFLVEHLDNEVPKRPPTYCAVRTGRFILVAYDTGEEELYDLRADPAELHNQADNPVLALERESLVSKMRTLCQPTPPDAEFKLPPA
jgi:arylsulfatase A-like enzyme